MQNQRSAACAGVLLIVWLLPATAHPAPSGETPGEAAPCALSGPDDALQCVQRNDARIHVARYQYEEALAGTELAEQRPNPEIQAGAGSLGSAQFEYRHIIELGDRRELRGDAARAAASEAAVQLELARQNAALETVILLHRLRHSEEELSLMQQTQQAFAGGYARLARLPARNAGQEVSLESFRLARDTAEQQSAMLRAEREGLRARIETLCQQPLSERQLRAIAAPHPDAWPEFPVRADDGAPELQIATRRAATAAARQRLMERQAWPDLRIGPWLNYNVQQGPGAPGIGSRRFGEWEAGVRVEFQIPLYHQNEGEADVARARVEQERRKLSGAEARVAGEYRALERSYRTLIESLKRQRSPAQLAARRRRLIAYLNRGLVAPALFLEYHRSFAEHLHQRHLAELAAIESLWRGYALTGRIFDEEL